METAPGKITALDEDGAKIFVSSKHIDVARATLRQYENVVVGFADGRSISPEQRRKAYALLGEIAEWVGDLPEFIKKQMKMEFIAARQTDMARQLFSLSDCDMTTAKEFISYLIDFILEHDVPTKTPLRELCEDIERYIWACLMNKRCAVCGKKADLHHFDGIGAGRDRQEVYQIGMRVIPLCRAHHGEAHTKGRSWLTDEQHLVAIPLTAEIGKKYGLSKKNLGVA
jgi:hypothetical protein